MNKERTCLIVLGVLVAFLFSVSLPIKTTSSSRFDSSQYRSSKAIALTSDGLTLLVVNPDSNSLTLIDLTTHSIITEISVGMDPRTVTVDDEENLAYTANRDSDSVSVIDLESQQWVTDIQVGYRPYGVIVNPSSDQLYVSEQGMDRLRVLDSSSYETIAIIETSDRPSGLALDIKRSKLYITHLLNNKISIINLDPNTTYLPILANGFNLENFKVSISPNPSSTSPIFLITDTFLWPDSNLIQSIIISPDGNHGYVPHTRSNTGNKALTFDTTVFPLVSILDMTTDEHLFGYQFDLGTLDPPGVGLPFDADITPDGRELWVLNAASNDVTVIDLDTRTRVAHIEVGANPRGIIFSPNGDKAYTNNTLDGTVTVIDPDSYTSIDVITAATIPLPPTLLQGKRLFHTSDDPRMSNAQWISCNSCHFDGEHDGRTWSFGFAGPRNTTSLLGMVQTYPLRWSGEWDESADSEFANKKENFGSGLIEGDMNCSLSPPDCVNHPPNQGRDGDLDALAAFIDSLQIPLSPGHANGEPLTDSELRGRKIFNDPALGCVACHPPPLYTDKQKHDVGTSTTDERIGPEYDTPSLRGLYNSAPYFHDGSSGTLYESLTRSTQNNEHDLSAKISENEIFDLIAFLEALPYEE